MSFALPEGDSLFVSPVLTSDGQKIESAKQLVQAGVALTRCSLQEIKDGANHELTHALADTNPYGGQLLLLRRASDSTVGMYYSPVGPRTDFEKLVIATAPGDDMSDGDKRIADFALEWLRKEPR